MTIAMLLTQDVLAGPHKVPTAPPGHPPAKSL
jgi:hypothetical protein